MHGFFSSGYRSCIHWPDRHHILTETVLAMRRLRQPHLPLKIVWHWHEAAEVDNCVWSPLIQGEIIRAGALYHHGEEVPEQEMLNWCIHVLRSGGWTHLIQCRTIPQTPGYGRSGMDRELEVAREIGLTVVSDIELIHA